MVTRPVPPRRSLRRRGLEIAGNDRPGPREKLKFVHELRQASLAEEEAM